MNLPSRLHVFLHDAAFQPWDEWYPAGQRIFADYVEEVMENGERAGKIREERPHYLPIIHEAEATRQQRERAEYYCRRRVLALFPEVEFEVTQQVLECAPHFASEDTLAPRTVQLLLADNSTLIKPIDEVKLTCTKEGKIAAVKYKITAPDLLTEDGPSPLRNAYAAFATLEAVERARR